MIDSDIDEFIGSLRYERSMAENTCAAYARDLRFFSQYLKKRGISAAGDVKREDIAGFLGEQRSEGRKSTTRARRATAIKVFFKFLRERRFVAKNPAELLEPPKKAKALPRVLSEEETFRMLDKVDGTDPRDLRDRAMLEVMYGCGLRVSELCAMKTEDIIADGELLRVIGKGSKERIVPIGRAAGRALVAYLASARDVFTKGDLSVGHVFVTRLKKPFTRQAVFKLIRERALAAGIAPERISPHVLRHCFADIGTNQIYTHVDATRFGDIHRRFHPRG